MRRKGRVTGYRRPAPRPTYHCQTCDSRIRHYAALVMRWDPSTDELRTPSGLVIRLRRLP